ncbi:AAA family ATPase [Spiroplasma chinense]|uniref:AAA family ATPase n=1 Tax=Spiroplasma chinense TaxID=216932 RepID=A0A5B9Y4H6_9MOLU|nr:AAA family ATPase [Spiroplasma chinense]QEH61860.1 AAA family ATPase [Spiroplasma chinense]
MSERYLKLKQFKNIAIDATSSKEMEKLILNYSIENPGDILTLIGPNNVGKSNILEAIFRIDNDEELEESDRVNFYNYNDSEPEINLIAKDEDDYYTLTKLIDQTFLETTNKNKEVIKHEWKQKTFRLGLETVNNALSIYDIWLKHRLNISREELETIEHTSEKILGIKEGKCFEKDETYCLSYFIILQKYITEYLRNNYNNSIDEGEENIFSTLENIDIVEEEPLSKEELEEYYEEIGCENPDYISGIYKNKYNLNFIPSVYWYGAQQFKSSDLTCVIEDEENPCDSFNNFLKTLIIDKFEISEQKITHTFVNDISGKNSGAIDKLNEEIASKTKEISKHFNDVFNHGEQKYEFIIKLNEAKIKFNILKSNEYINIDDQSEGFKWFFNFYFNFLYMNELQYGDIVLIDEAASNLHPSAAIEFRKFLKKFAFENKITFVLATHSPFVVDNDYLEELRIIRQDDKSLKIQNHFTVKAFEEEDDRNVTKGILEALTVKQHVILDPENIVIFVEGMTDYLYLTAMKIVLGYEKIHFLPVQGVKDGKKVIEEVKRIKKDPIFLVDGDDAGKKFKEETSKLINECHTLNDFGDFTVIESLFSKKIIDNFNLNNKTIANAVNFKNLVINNNELIDKKTEANFRKIFDTLLD